ncbi:MAG: hypothetical protein F6K14_18755 [Symploca sp. SIO2C1]|nr:hypothetical protein [Symploca sp. SIO2C1]
MRSLFLVGWVEQQVFITVLPETNIGETQHPNLPSRYQIQCNSAIAFGNSWH